MCLIFNSVDPIIIRTQYGRSLKTYVRKIMTEIGFGEGNIGRFAEITLGQAKMQAHLNEIIQFDLTWILSLEVTFVETKTNKITPKIEKQ